MMELKEYVSKFPSHWRGIFAALSKNDAVLTANSWLLENREGALFMMHHQGRGDIHSCRSNYNDWMGLVDGLSEMEPTILDNKLDFVPRILLFPLHIQRNCLAFLVDNSSKVPLHGLELLLDSFSRCKPRDGWMKFHLTTIRKLVCQRKCLSPTIDQSDLSKESLDLFQDICQRITGVGSSTSGVDESSTESNLRQGPLSPSSELVASPVKTQRSERLVTEDIIEISDSELPSSSTEVAMETDSPRMSVVQNYKVEATLEDSLTENGQHIGGLPEETDFSKLMDSVTMERLTRLKTTLNTADEGGILPVEHLQVLVDCPISAQMEMFCDFLDFDSLPMAGLVVLSRHLANFSLELSCTSSVILARKCFCKRIQNLTQPPHRSLITAVLNLAKTFPKQTIEGALLPSLVETEDQKVAANHRGDLVTKVVKEALTNESRVYLLSNLISVKTLRWSEAMTNLFHTAIGCKLILDSQTLESFIVALEHHGRSQRSCPRFAKFLLALINHFNKQFNSVSLSSLRRLAEMNQTFLKKALSAALRRIVG